MDNSTKKDLASNWFQLLQNAICNDILELEKLDNLKQNYNQKPQ